MNIHLLRTELIGRLDIAQDRALEHLKSIFDSARRRALQVTGADIESCMDHQIAERIAASLQSALDSIQVASGLAVSLASLAKENSSPNPVETLQSLAVAYSEAYAQNRKRAQLAATAKRRALAEASKHAQNNLSLQTI